MKFHTILKKLASHTLIYGISSTIGRLLLFLLVPFYTRIFEQTEYGIVTEFYAYVGFAMVFLSFGLETAFLRFFYKEDKNPKVFSSLLWFSIGLNGFFLIIAFMLIPQLSSLLGYQDFSYYLMLMLVILILDAVSTVPLARLRALEKPVSFSLIKLTELGLTLGLNIFFLVLCRNQYLTDADSWLGSLYNEQIGVGYIFIANLAGSLLKFLLLSPSFSNIKTGLDKPLLKKCLSYAWPLVLVGFAGMANELFDRAMLKQLLPNSLSDVQKLAQLGIYGANYKLAVPISMFILAFRYAAEPLFFSKAKELDAKEIYVKMLNCFVAAVAGVFVFINVFIHYFKFLIGPNFREGLDVVPILLLAYVFFGIAVNLSIWYKLSNKTLFGAGLAAIVAIITIILNVIFIPKYGYYACAWITLCSFFILAVGSYLLGLKYYPVRYEISKVILLISIGIAMVLMHIQLQLYFGINSNLKLNLLALTSLSIYSFCAWFILGKPKFRVS